MDNPPTMLNTLIVMPLGEQKGGGELMLIQLLQQCRQPDIRFTVVFLEDGPMVKTVRELGTEVILIPAGRLRQPIKLLRTVRAIGAVIRERKIDLVIGWMGKAHIYGGTAAMLNHTRAMWYQLDRSNPRSILDRIIHWIPATAVLCCGPEGFEIEKTFKPKRPVKLVLPGADLDRFDSAILPTMTEARRQLGLPEGVPLIGLVGRLQFWKGIHVLIEAMPAVLKRFPAAQAIIVGGKHDFEPDYPALLDQKIKELGVEANVRLVGLQKNVPLWMQAMDVIVHASRNEPFGIVVIEAMALGKPVIAGSQGGPKTVVTPGVDGLLVDFGDYGKLGQAITDVLSDATRSSQMATRGRDRARQFSSQHYANQFTMAIRELLKTDNDAGGVRTSPVMASHAASDVEHT